MPVVTERANTAAFVAAGQGDFSFMVEVFAEPEFGKPVADWIRTPVVPYLKNYGEDGGIDDGAALFIARLDDRLAGHLAVSRNWNGYALIEMIGVDRSMRGQGIGSALIEQAIAWTKVEKLPGLMLETQNNNLAACALYEKHGFRLGGIDRCLYQGLDPQSSEIALFWYREV